jgi:hypothetical protein
VLVVLGVVLLWFAGSEFILLFFLLLFLGVVVSLKGGVGWWERVCLFVDSFRYSLVG